MLIVMKPKIIQLVPPKIATETISETLVGTRPVRNGKFNISMQHNHGKTIVNCYGHGGSGWTTLFGSIDKAIKLFKATNPKTSTPIRVIGSGCMGLTAAIELARQGYRVAGISTKSLYDMPSWKAAGYFALVSLNTSPGEHANLNEIGLKTFLTYQQIDHGAHPYISKDAVKFIPVFCSADTDSGIENFAASGILPARENVTLDFGNGVIHHDYVKYMTYFMNTTIAMRQLIKETTRLKIAIEEKTIDAFDQITEEVIFNCSGLGGRELNADSHMVPVRGHLITLNENAGTGHMDYMIYTKVMQNGKEERIYMFPKSISVTPECTEGVECFGVLGGTFIPNVDMLSAAEQEKLDRKEFKRLLDRNSEFFHGHPYSE